jgi:hypothetical protein
MNILSKLLGKKECLICHGGVDVTDASKLMATSKDITSPVFSYGNICKHCNGAIHYKCCQYVITEKQGVKIKVGICPKCNNPVLMFIPKQ